MKVRELATLLSQKDPNAEVLIMAQRRWPYECRVAGVAERREFDAPGERGDSSTLESDVFLVEGSVVRYGSRKAWDAAEVPKKS